MSTSAWSVARVLGTYTVWPEGMDDPVGFTVIEAGTGEDGLDAVSREHPHIVLLDYKLPGISGLDVLERLGTASLLVLQPL